MALIVSAVFAALLAAPLLGEALFGVFSKSVERGAKGGVLLGLAVLLIGLASGARVLEIAGGALLGAILLAVIVDNYLAPDVRAAGSGARSEPRSSLLSWPLVPDPAWARWRGSGSPPGP